ncbi:MAG: hypothetical protein JWN01_651 [Patescibacteria group bacterium]|nr:hypothetical protein [Patescibacteria group bacterium]
MRHSKFLLAFTAGLMLVPSLALAEQNHDNKASRTPEPTHTPRIETEQHRQSPTPKPKVEPAAFCGRFADATGKVGSDTTDRFNELETKFGQRAGKVNDDFAGVAGKMSANRKTADQKLTEDFAKLDAKATTTGQKAAADAFKTAVGQAVAARRAAVDAANNTFHQGVLASVSARQAQLKAAAATYRTAVAAALAQAKASCTAGTDPAAVRATLQASLKTAHTNLENARKAADKVGPNLDTLKAARKTAVEKANTDFKAAIKKALDDLRAVLHVASPTP